MHFASRVHHLLTKPLPFIWNIINLWHIPLWLQPDFSPPSKSASECGKINRPKSFKTTRNGTECHFANPALTHNPKATQCLTVFPHVPFPCVLFLCGRHLQRPLHTKARKSHKSVTFVGVVHQSHSTPPLSPGYKQTFSLSHIINLQRSLGF